MSKWGHAVSRQTPVPTADTAKPWNVFAQMDVESPFQLEDDVQVQWEK
jgi:hypothetical protein